MSLSANELRIGNLFKGASRGEIEVVTADVIKGIADGKVNALPVPLTAEVLERCGIKDCEDFAGEWTYFKLDDKDNQYYLICDYVKVSNKPFNYLHEVQNVHFALTGEELEVSL